MGKNFYPEQYQKTGVHPINHNYLQKQFADYKSILDKVSDVVLQGDFTLGKAVDEFEQQFAAINGGDYAVGVGSGTDALFLSLKALGIGFGDEVITTPFTFFATVGAIVTAGAKPVFVDIGDDHNIDASLIESAITEKTKAIMPVHWAGIPCDMQNINAIAQRHSLKVIADACHAIQARYQDNLIAKWADVSCFSMHPLKNLNVWGDGGVIVINNKEMHDHLSLIRNHGLVDRDHCSVWAYNSRLDTLQAVVAIHLLENKLENITRTRQHNAAYLNKALADIGQVQLPNHLSNAEGVFHLYMARFQRRGKLQDFLQAKGIDAKVHYPIPMHLQPAAKDLGYKVGDFPVAENLADNCLSLPVHEFISEDDLDYMIAAIEEFYR